MPAKRCSTTCGPLCGVTVPVTVTVVEFLTVVAAATTWRCWVRPKAAAGAAVPTTVPIASSRAVPNAALPVRQDVRM